MTVPMPRINADLFHLITLVLVLMLALQWLIVFYGVVRRTLILQKNDSLRDIQTRNKRPRGSRLNTPQRDEST